MVGEEKPWEWAQARREAKTRTVKILPKSSMKLLYLKSTGDVIARYSDATSVSGPSSESLQDDQALIETPPSVRIPHAVIRVIPATEETPAEFVTDDSMIDRTWLAVKSYRNQKLRDSDWICSVTDYVVMNKTAWIQYRQQLRDITQQVNPFALTWPAEPPLLMGLPPNSQV